MIDNSLDMDFADCLAAFFECEGKPGEIVTNVKKPNKEVHVESLEDIQSNRRLQRIYVYQENMVLEGVLDGAICLVLRDKSREYADKYAKKLQDLLNLSEGFFKVTVGDLYPNKKPVNLTIQFI